MGVRFDSGFGGHRSYALRRKRFMFVGGSTVLFLMMMIGIVVIWTRTNVQAREEIIHENEDGGFGSVVLIAPTSQIPRGAKISAGNLKEISWPRDQVPEGALKSMEDAENMFATATLLLGQPILRTNISANALKFGIEGQLPPGHRAVTIEVDSVTGIEGWTQPGAHVDVYLTYVEPKEGKRVTRIAVENAVVLSLGGSAKKTNSEEGVENTKVANTVTLAVPVNDSLKIQTAKAMGRITLALRNPNDVASPGAEEFNSDQWEQKPAAKEQVKFVKGWAKYTDGSGKPHDVALGSDNNWFHNQEDR